MSVANLYLLPPTGTGDLDPGDFPDYTPADVDALLVALHGAETPAGGQVRERVLLRAYRVAEGQVARLPDQEDLDGLGGQRFTRGDALRRIRGILQGLRDDLAPSAAPRGVPESSTVRMQTGW